jgi:hypothetical protein
MAVFYRRSPRRTTPNHDRILELHAAAISAGLAGSRLALLGDIDGRSVAELPQVGAPGQQILVDLDEMNATEHLIEVEGGA